jgi:aminoglycoside 6'-N-acetyltransferase I
VNVTRVETGDEALWARAVARLVSEDDRDRRLASPADLTDALADSRCYLYVALIDSEPTGLLSAYCFPDVQAGGNLAYLYDIEVAQEHRRLGVGAALVTELVSQCREDGVRRIWAGTDLNNIPARRTFEATGADLEGETYIEYVWDLET